MTKHEPATADTPTWRDPSRSPEERVEALLTEMTLEEKAAQLGSIWFKEAGQVEGGEVAPMESAMRASARPPQEALADGLGHLTRVFGTAPVTARDGMTLLRQRQQEVVAGHRLGIPAIAHEECLTGFTTYQATVYPTPLAWGATFAPALVEEMATRIGADMAAVGIHQGLSPVLDVVRDPRWGRTEEAIGEDPYLVGVLATGYVRGLQAGGVDATLKHFAGYSASRAARNHAPVSIGPRELADVMLPPFEMAVREGAAHSVMNSYADLDGEPPAASHRLLTELLRGSWGFTGTVVSDYWAVTFLHTMHRVAAGVGEAGALALEAGMDVELPETGGYDALPELVRGGRLTEDLLDRAARRVLLQKARHGLLDAGWRPAEPVHRELDPPENRELARRLAADSVVLLANDGTLPLGGGGGRPGRVALVGPVMGEPRTLLGCYSFPNHVLSRYAERGTGVEVPAVGTALRTALADSAGAGDAPTVVSSWGCDVTGEDRRGFPDAVRRVTEADVAVVAVGDLAGMFGTGTSGEGCDAPDLRLPGVQHDLVEALLETGTPVVLLVVSGRPYALGGLAERCAAVVQAFFPGEEGAAALAAVLTGAVNPSGRLPVSIPREPGAQPYTYRAAPLGQGSDGVSTLDPTPLFPFGHGLHYGEVEYGQVSSDRNRMAVDGEVTVAVDVANPAERAVEEVVQLYLSDPVAEVVRPVRELVGFTRVPLGPGARARVSFRVHADRLSFTGRDLQRVVEPGEVVLAVGRSSADLVGEVSVQVIGERRVLTGARVMTTPAVVS